MTSPLLESFASYLESELEMDLIGQKEEYQGVSGTSNKYASIRQFLGMGGRWESPSNIL